MGAYPVGGGGGRIRTPIEVGDPALSKPYDMKGEWTGLKSDQLDEMLETLFRTVRQGQDTVTNIINNPTSGGDVFGPASATDGHLALFDTGTGKLIKDGGALPTFFIKSVTLALTDAQIKALNVTPITILAAEAGIINIPLFLAGHIVTTTGYNTSQTISPRYIGGGSTIFTGSVYATTAVEDNWRWAPNTNTYNAGTGFSPVNKAIELVGAVGMTGGNVANVVTMYMQYYRFTP